MLERAQRPPLTRRQLVILGVGILFAEIMGHASRYAIIIGCTAAAVWFAMFMLSGMLRFIW